jgi:methylmalonyl-CoA mutase
MAEAFSRLTLGLAIDAEPLGGMAKLRAARVLWARIADACGVDAPARIEARSSRRMLTRADRWTNLVRLTSAGFAAAVGGADTIVLGAFTDAAGAPDAFALRIARNTQLVLMEEAHLGRVSDPAGGAWAVEAQTGDLARAAWDHFRTIEAAGGLAAALARGVVAEGVAAARAALAVAIAERRLRILGVTDFKADETVPEAAPGAASAAPAVPALPGADGACPALGAIRLEEMAQ